ncbi:unnamed protein product [Closterium sp. Yama58-4]|nr:unnamed protein product [Closterium sp. Yama58-4]
MLRPWTPFPRCAGGAEVESTREPPPVIGSAGTPEIFEQGGTASVIRRAVIIGNGHPGSEHQCLGLVRALGLGGSMEIQRVVHSSGKPLETAAGSTNGRNGTFANGTFANGTFSNSTFANGTFANNNTTNRAFANGTFVNGTSSSPFHTSDPFHPRYEPTQHTPRSVLHPRSSTVSAQRPRILSEASTSAFLPAAAPADPAAIAREANETLESEGPVLVVAAGRDTAAAAAEVKRLAPSSTLVVQIQHPRNDLHQYDLVVAPLHDFYGLTAAAGREVPSWILKWIAPAPPAKNVVLTTGALHIAEPSLLRSAAATWHSLSDFPKPLVVVNIGGPTRHCSYRPDLIAQLARTLKEMLQECQGSLSISFSRRTPMAMERVLQQELKDQDAVYIWDGQGLDPHLGNLAWADAFIITADSVSMISEACSTGKPVYVVGGENCKWKIAEFHRTLQRRGAIRPFNSSVNLASTWSYPPLTDNVDVATRVRAEVAKRGWVLHPSRYLDISKTM